MFLLIKKEENYESKVSAGGIGIRRSAGDSTFFRVKLTEGIAERREARKRLS